MYLIEALITTIYVKKFWQQYKITVSKGLSWIYNYLCNQCLSPLKLWVWILLRQFVLDITLCDKVCQWLCPGTPVSSTNKTDHHDIAEISFKVVLNTKNQPTDIKILNNPMFNPTVLYNNTEVLILYVVLLFWSFEVICPKITYS